MSENELDFFRRRAFEEGQRAELSHDQVVADIHRQMAIAYANRVAKIEKLQASNVVQAPLSDQDSTSSR